MDNTLALIKDIGLLIITALGVLTPFFTKKIDFEKTKFNLLKQKELTALQGIYSRMLDVFYKRHIDTYQCADYKKMSEDGFRDFLKSYNLSNDYVEEVVGAWLLDKNTSKTPKAIEKARLHEAKKAHSEAIKYYQDNEIYLKEDLSKKLSEWLSSSYSYIIYWEDYKDANLDREDKKTNLDEKCATLHKEVKELIRQEFTNYKV